MALEKATIIVIETNERIPVMFNPEEYSLDVGNTFAEIGIPGLKTPPIQYVRGNSRILKMDLFFDTFELRRDVRRLTEQITSLLNQNPATQAPPILIFSWGGFNFRCVLESVGQSFTMFIEDGTPVRATLSVSFREYEAVNIEIQRGFFFGPPTIRNTVSAAVNLIPQNTRDRITAEVRNFVEGRIHQVVEGETLSLIAGAVRGDPEAWREIAEANNIDDPLNLEPGTELFVPTLTYLSRLPLARRIDQ